MEDLIQVYMTVSSQEEGQRVAQSLVKNRLAACVQVLGPIQSTYWWQGNIETSQEWICLAKSRKEKFDQLVHQVKELHSYEVPEIIATPLVALERNYALWLKEELNKTP